MPGSQSKKLRLLALIGVLPMPACSGTMAPDGRVYAICATSLA
jgi:hypothetical protein